MSTVKRYSELRRIHDFEGRYDYLRLDGAVGQATFGFDRFINQQFYRSTQWKHVRNVVIARDLGCDLGIEGYEIHDRVYIHHMNPMTPEQIEHGDADILDPEYLVCVTHRTHNAIHYGDKKLLSLPFVERTRNDTIPWRR